MLVPAAQGWHVIWPVVLEKVFAGQGVHRVEPSLGAKEPARQALGVAVAGVAHWKPLGQRSQVPERGLLA